MKMLKSITSRISLQGTLLTADHQLGFEPLNTIQKLIIQPVFHTLGVPVNTAEVKVHHAIWACEPENSFQLLKKDLSIRLFLTGWSAADTY